MKCLKTLEMFAINYLYVHVFWLFFSLETQNLWQQFKHNFIPNSRQDFILWQEKTVQKKYKSFSNWIKKKKKVFYFMNARNAAHISLSLSLSLNIFNFFVVKHKRKCINLIQNILTILLNIILLKMKSNI